jgi:capsular polysaccharide biosynthesis protein/Mrp family chromosome partitioning ATPase
MKGSPVNDERVHSGRYLRALREHWPFILGTMAIAVAAAVFLVQASDKRYEAGADILVTPVPSATFVGIPVLRESNVSSSVVAAARIAKSPQVVERAKHRLGLEVRREQLLTKVAVAPQEQSSVLTITGKAGSPEQAARIANAFADALLNERTTQLQRDVRAAVARLAAQLEEVRSRNDRSPVATALAERLSDLRSLLGARDPTLQIVSRAVPPETAVWPRPALSVAVALVAGLLLGMGIAVALEVVNPLVLTEADVVERAGPPILARVPFLPERLVRRELTDNAGGPARSVLPFRALWANLATRAGGRRRPETIVVASSGHNEGKSITAVGLAVAVGLTGLRVILVDADFTRRTASRLLVGTRLGHGGLGAVLVDSTPVEDALVPAKRLGASLRVLTSNPDDESLLALVPPDRLGELIEELKSLADVVIVDAPIIPGASEGLVLAAVADALVIAVRLGHTRRERLAQVRRDLSQSRVSPAGYVIVGRKRLAREPSLGVQAARSDAPQPGRADVRESAAR